MCYCFPTFVILLHSLQKIGFIPTHSPALLSAYLLDNDTKQGYHFCVIVISGSLSFMTIIQQKEREEGRREQK